MVTLRLGSKKVLTYRDLLDSFPLTTFASPRRSTVPLLDYWREQEPRLQALGAAIGVDLTPPADLSFEFAVPVESGHGKASFTDLMISTANTVVAVEAKFTEPAYESIRTWLREPPEENRVQVLSGWLHLIRSTTGCALEQTRILDLPYQIVHRTASACSVARSVRSVVYLVFGPDPVEHYANDLAALQAMLGQRSGIGFHLVECGLEKLPAFQALETRWQLKDPATSEAVRAALVAGPLFVFQPLKPRTFPR